MCCGQTRVYLNLIVSYWTCKFIPTCKLVTNTVSKLLIPLIYTLKVSETLECNGRYSTHQQRQFRNIASPQVFEFSTPLGQFMPHEGFSKLHRPFLGSFVTHENISQPGTPVMACGSRPSVEAAITRHFRDSKTRSESLGLLPTVFSWSPKQRITLADLRRWFSSWRVGKSHVASWSYFLLIKKSRLSIKVTNHYPGNSVSRTLTVTATLQKQKKLKLF